MYFLSKTFVTVGKKGLVTPYSKNPKQLLSFYLGVEGKGGSEIPDMHVCVDFDYLPLLVEQEWSKSRGATALH